ncbi:MAG: T9SS type A sorting domain-containing protein, partial [Bacteroidetes bacterium]|nr:T9SS type A sorting domain-containing protein [Bacteroidota bacterium]
EWTLKVPDSVISHSIRFSFGSIKATDANTGLAAFEVNNSVAHTITTEIKRLKLSKLNIAASRKTALEDQQIDSLLVLTMETQNLGQAPLTNPIAARSFTFAVEELDVISGQYTRVKWSDYLDTLYIYRFRSGSILGWSTNSKGDSLAVVTFIGQQGSVPKIPALRRGFGDSAYYVREGDIDTISFSADLLKPVTSSLRPNFRIRLTSVQAVDFDSLGFLAGANLQDFPGVTVVDDRGRTIEEAAADTSGEFASATSNSRNDNTPSAYKFLNYPNPFGGVTQSTNFRFDAASVGNATIEIYTLAGNLVRKLSGEAITGPNDENTSNDWTWDGRNMHGEKVRNGVYIAVLKAPGIKATTKVLVTR